MAHGGKRVLLTVAVLGVLAPGCSDDGKSASSATPASSGSSTTTSVTATPTSTAGESKFDIAPADKAHPDGKMVGAPFDDPCTLLSPDDIPAEFRTDDNRKVLRAKPVPEEGTLTSCDFGRYEGVGGNPKKASAVSVGWNKRDHVPDVSDDPGWQSKKINGRNAIYHHNDAGNGTSPRNNCSLFMDAPKGVVVLTAMMSSFPDKDACKAVLPMAGKVALTLH